MKLKKGYKDLLDKVNKYKNEDFKLFTELKISMFKQFLEKKELKRL